MNYWRVLIILNKNGLNSLNNYNMVGQGFRDIYHNLWETHMKITELNIWLLCLKQADTLFRPTMIINPTIQTQTIHSIMQI